MDLKVDLWQFGIISDVTPQIDIMELEQSQTLETALELMSGTNARFSYSSLAYYSMIALRPHVPRLQSWSLIFCASGVASDILRFQGWASFKFPLIRPNENWRKVIARELLRLQKRNVTSWRNILETKTCQCRTSVHTSTAKILKFLFYLETWRCMVKSMTSCLWFSFHPPLTSSCTLLEAMLASDLCLFFLHCYFPI